MTLSESGLGPDSVRGSLLAVIDAAQKNITELSAEVVSLQDILSNKQVRGAMGQTQFMPSAFLAHAVDADGDGRRDIWRSMPDVLASTANYLRKAGWVAGEPCAPELRLPADFNPERADPDTRQDSAQWAAEGLTLADGSPLPAMAQASVLQAAGVNGPAFLVGRNFRAVLRYNNATSYALGVCLLAQRIDGGVPVQAAWPRDQRPLGRSEVKALQTALNQRGLAAGEADGLFGPATRKALRAWQRSQGRPADGFPTAEVLPAKRFSFSLYRTNIDDGQGFSDISHFPVTLGFGVSNRVELFAAMNAVYARHFGDPPPARSTVQVSRLPRDVKVEIDVIAVLA